MWKSLMQRRFFEIWLGKRLADYNSFLKKNSVSKNISLSLFYSCISFLQLIRLSVAVFFVHADINDVCLVLFGDKSKNQNWLVKSCKNAHSWKIHSHSPTVQFCRHQHISLNFFLLLIIILKKFDFIFLKSFIIL